MIHVGHSRSFGEDSNARKNREIYTEAPLWSSAVWICHVTMLELATWSWVTNHYPQQKPRGSERGPPKPLLSQLCPGKNEQMPDLLTIYLLFYFFIKWVLLFCCYNGGSTKIVNPCNSETGQFGLKSWELDLPKCSEPFFVLFGFLFWVLFLVVLGFIVVLKQGFSVALKPVLELTL